MKTQKEPTSSISRKATFSPFIYGGIEIKETCFTDITPWFTRRAIGEWLGYKHPQKAVDKIIERNPHIQNPEWETAVNLTVVEGGKQVVRTIKVYNPIGLQLIVFESRQPKAIQYKIAVAKLVNDMMTGQYMTNIVKDYLSGKCNFSQS